MWGIALKAVVLDSRAYRAAKGAEVSAEEAADPDRWDAAFRAAKQSEVHHACCVHEGCDCRCHNVSSRTAVIGAQGTTRHRPLRSGQVSSIAFAESKGCARQSKEWSDAHQVPTAPLPAMPGAIGLGGTPASVRLLQEPQTPATDAGPLKPLCRTGSTAHRASLFPLFVASDSQRHVSASRAEGSHLPSQVSNGNMTALLRNDMLCETLFSDDLVLESDPQVQTRPADNTPKTARLSQFSAQGGRLHSASSGSRDGSTSARTAETHHDRPMRLLQAGSHPYWQRPTCSGSSGRPARLCPSSVRTASRCWSWKT